MARRINAHEHAWTTPDVYPWVSNLTPYGVNSLVYDIDDVRRDMDEYDIDQTVLIASPIHGRGSPYTIECLHKYPDEMYGIILLDYFADDIAAQVDDVMAIENLLGFRFGAAMQWGTMWQDAIEGDSWIIDPGLDAFWEAIEGHDAPQVQMLLNAPQLPEAQQVIDAHPSVTFVLDHLAWPDPQSHPADGPPYRHLRDIAEHPNVYVKITRTPSLDPYPFEDVHDYIRNLLDWFGSDRLLWGTDWVYHFKRATPWETIHFLDELSFLSSKDRRDFEYRTFESMLP